MSQTKEMHLNETQLKQILDDFFLVLSDKEKTVLTKRFSLDNQPKQTLEKIGKHFSVTRERIRQIENTAIKKLRRNFNSSQLRHVSEVAKKILLENGEVMSEKDFLSCILREIHTITPFSGNVAKLALALDEKLERINKTKDFNIFWRLKSFPIDSLVKIERSLQKLLKKSGDVMSEEAILVNYSKDLYDMYSPATPLSVLRISPQFCQTKQKMWGLRSWRHINPKSIRDKAVIVLDEVKKPLHFIEIANKISELGLHQKSVTIQAVHNELIRYDDFVLVGRGLYGLSKWGFPAGTVMDIIAMILEKKGPLKKSEIIEETRKLRDVKESTISLNLQKCEAFVRVGRAVYAFDKNKWEAPSGGRGRAHLKPLW
jgi:DNA-directed RNA polymerase delta subunit